MKICSEAKCHRSNVFTVPVHCKIEEKPICVLQLIFLKAYFMKYELAFLPSYSAKGSRPIQMYRFHKAQIDLSSSSLSLLDSVVFIVQIKLLPLTLH